MGGDDINSLKLTMTGHIKESPNHFSRLNDAMISIKRQCNLNSQTTDSKMDSLSQRAIQTQTLSMTILLVLLNLLIENH